MNKREKMIAIGVGAVLGLWALDALAIEPYVSSWHDVNQQLSAEQARKDKDDKLLDNRKRVQQAWQRLLAGGLKSDASAAQNSSFRDLTDWAQKYDVNAASLKADKEVQDGDFQQIRIAATFTGHMSGICKLLYDIESATDPMQVGDVRINSTKDGTDDLTATMTITALVYSPQTATTKPTRRTASSKE